VRIARLAIGAAEDAWLAAVGLAIGDEVIVLRRAPFGGPLHVRTRAGGEFAIDRALAARIEVEPAAAIPDELAS
jgi:ferrous iron transport protein A